MFLGWAFQQSTVDRWFDELEGDANAVEGVINHLHVWDVFSLKGPEDYLAASALGVRVEATWRAALREAYPDREFDVNLTDELDDYGPTLTFKSRWA